MTKLPDSLYLDLHSGLTDLWNERKIPHVSTRNKGGLTRDARILLEALSIRHRAPFCEGRLREAGWGEAADLARRLAEEHLSKGA